MLPCNSKGFCAVKYKKPSGSVVLIICAYLPTDYGTVASPEEFIFTLAELGGYIDLQDFENLAHHR